jgi:hypothetical protein
MNRGWNAVLRTALVVAVLAVPPPAQAMGRNADTLVIDERAQAIAPVSAMFIVESYASPKFDFNIGKTNTQQIGATAALEPSAPALPGRSRHSVTSLPARYTKYGGATTNTEVNTAFAVTSTNTGAHAAGPAHVMTVLDRTARMNE